MRDKSKLTKKDLQLEKVLQRGIRSVLRKQIKLGYPIAVYKNGKSVILPAKKVKL